MFKNCCKMNPVSLEEEEKEIPVIKAELFTKVKELGEGGFGYVALYNFEAEKGKIEQVVIKRIKKKEKKTEDEYRMQFDKEVKPLRRLREHPNLVRLIGTTTIEGLRGVVLEYMGGGDLYDVIHNQTSFRYSLRDVLNWNIQSARALEYMHSFNADTFSKYIHRDIKPQNMLLDSTCQILKIADFGLSKEIYSLKNTKGTGTKQYMAPEVFQDLLKIDEKDFAFYGEKCDVYSWTLTFWECLTGLMPFAECPNDAELKIKKQQFENLAYVSSASSALNFLIRLGSNRNADLRLSMKSWRRILEILIKNCDLLEKQNQEKINDEKKKKNSKYQSPYVWILNERMTGEFYYGKGLEKFFSPMEDYKWDHLSPGKMEKFLDELEIQQVELEIERLELLLADLKKSKA